MKTIEPQPSRPASAPRAAAPSIFDAAPVGNDALALALGRIGFGAAGATPAKPMAAPHQPSRAEQRRDWILETMERQRDLSPRTAGLPRVRGLTREAFLDNFYAASRPVVIEGALAGWPALKRWTPDYLKRVVGDATVEYQGGRDAAGDFELAKDRHKTSGPFTAFIDRIAQPGNDAYLTAYNSAANRAALRPLEADLGHLDAYLTDAPGMLWLGPGGTFTPLHFDLTNNLIAQVVGTKHLLLAPPSETSKLANHRHVFSDVHDLADPERLARYPAAKAARTFAVELRAGDAIFVPIGWWHQVRSQSFSATLTYTDFLWPNDGYADFPPD